MRFSLGEIGAAMPGMRVPPLPGLRLGLIGAPTVTANLKEEERWVEK